MTSGRNLRHARVTAVHLGRFFFLSISFALCLGPRVSRSSHKTGGARSLKRRGWRLRFYRSRLRAESIRPCPPSGFHHTASLTSLTLNYDICSNTQLTRGVRNNHRLGRSVEINPNGLPDQATYTKMSAHSNSTLHLRRLPYLVLGQELLPF